MKIIKDWLGINDMPPKQTFKPSFKTTVPNEKLSFDRWCIEFRVSCLHGKTITYIG